LKNGIFLPFCVLTSLCLIEQGVLCLNTALRQVMQCGHFSDAKSVFMSSPGADLIEGCASAQLEKRSQSDTAVVISMPDFAFTEIRLL
jgi:hypothetical protein